MEGFSGVEKVQMYRAGAYSLVGGFLRNWIILAYKLEFFSDPYANSIPSMHHMQQEHIFIRNYASLCAASWYKKS
jgi:hypothetical protein